MAKYKLILFLFYFSLMLVSAFNEPSQSIETKSFNVLDNNQNCYGLSYDPQKDIVDLEDLTKISLTDQEKKDYTKILEEKIYSLYNNIGICDIKDYLQVLNRELNLNLKDSEIDEIYNKIIEKFDSGKSLNIDKLEEPNLSEIINSTELSIKRDKQELFSASYTSKSSPLPYRYDTADYLIGGTYIVVIFVNDSSNKWSQSDINYAMNMIGETRDWIETNSPSQANVDVSSGYYLSKISSNPNDCSDDDYDCECRDWMNEALNNIGFYDTHSDGDAIDELNNYISSWSNSENVYPIFMVRNVGLLDADSSYSCSGEYIPRIALFYYEFCVLGICNKHESDAYTHESLHTFSADDEYPGPWTCDNSLDCSREVRWGYINGNCDYCSGTQDSIMKCCSFSTSSWASSYTKGQIGWGNHDSDSILDPVDNCMYVYNPSQENTDGDSQGNACDSDDDNDGILDSVDNCPSNYNPNQTNNEGDSLGDACDLDDDNDGTLDVNDACQFVSGTYCYGCPIPSCQQGYSPNCSASGPPTCVQDICIPNIINVSLTGWQDVSCLINDKMNQSNTFIEYDSKNCGTFQNLTFTQYRQTEECNYCQPKPNIGEDFFKFEKGNTKFQLSYSVFDVIGSTITSTYPNEGMPTLLADGTYTDNDNDEFDYTQQINLANWTLNMFDDNDYKIDTPTIGVKIAGGMQVLNYTLEFIDKPYWSDLTTSEIPLLGKKYFVLSETKNTTLNLLDSASGTIILSEGEIKTINVGGKFYEVGINSIGSSTVKLNINGETTNALSVAETQRLIDGTYVGIKKINITGIKTVEFVIGKGKFKLIHGQEAELNDETITGLKTTFTNDGDGTDDQLSKINLKWTTDEDTFIADGSSPVMPGFKVINLSFEGMYYPTQEKIIVGPLSSTTITLKEFPLKDSVENIDLIYVQNSSAIGCFNITDSGIGRDIENQLATSSITTLNFNNTKHEQFITSWSDGTDAESYLMKFGGWVQESGVEKVNVQYKKDGVWTTVKAKAKAGDTVLLGNMEFIITFINSTGVDKWANITSVGNTNFSTLYSKEGAKFYLPWCDINATAASTGLSNFGPWSQPTQGTTANSTWRLRMQEEDKDENIGSGSTINLTMGFNSASTPEVHVSALQYSHPTRISTDSGSASEIGTTDKFLNYVYSPLATEVIWDKSTNQYKIEMTYHDAESYGNIFISSLDLNNVKWSEWQNQTSCINGNMIQNRSRIEYDLNYNICYAITHLPSDLWNNGENKTYWEFRNQTCDFCKPNISTSSTNWQNISCTINNGMNQSRINISYDLNKCINSSTGNLEYQNKTIYEYQQLNNSCDFCNYTLSYTNWTTWQNQAGCLVNNTQVQNRSRVQYDSNYKNCYAITNLSSDLWNNGLNKTEWEFNNTNCTCVPNLINNSWTDWQDISCLPSGKMNQSRYLVQYDSESCPNSQNQTIYEYQTTENCSIPLFLVINSPQEEIYNNRRIYLNLSLNVILNKIEYMDNSDSRPHWSTLCINCNNYNKLKIFSDGNHNLTFKGTSKNGQTIFNQTSFFIDSKDPQISSTKPSSNRYTNGSDFYIKYTEENLNKTELILGGKTFTLSCPSGKNQECFSNLDISDYNNLGTSYYFKLTDIAGNIDESRSTKIKVDTTSPKITKFGNWTIGRYAYFNLTINELNFDAVEYIDNSDSRPRWKILCPTLKNNICYKKVYFKTGNHNVIIRVLDEAGNSYIKEINFII
ncbi:MAG: thrombospondin type 3 repeat-containing protein [Candidatus Pacearchaeota archaeon]